MFCRLTFWWGINESDWSTFCGWFTWLRIAAGDTIMTLTGYTREYWTLRKTGKQKTIKEAIYSKENDRFVNILSFKLPNICKLILQESRKAKQKNNRQKFNSQIYNIGLKRSMIPHRSAPKFNHSKTTQGGLRRASNPTR